MSTFSASPQFCYEARMLSPIARAVREGKYRSPVLDVALVWLASLEPEARVPILTAHALLDLIASITNDPTLGLRAARHASASPDCLFDPVVSTPTTVRASIEQAGQRLRTLSEASRYRLELRCDYALVRLDHRIALSALGEDFQTCSVLVHLLARWPNAPRASLDVWFRHNQPAALDAYRGLLGEARLHFAAQVSGFSFPARLLDAALVRPRAVRRLALCGA